MNRLRRNYPLLMPATRAEATIYRFYYGRPFSYGGINCRCTVLPING